MDAKGPLRLRFDAFDLDEADAVLTRDRSRIDLPPKAFGVLCALARQPGRLVLKDALLDEVWGHRHVSESVLKTTVSELRAALDDDAKKPRYIETVSRRGYRFIASFGSPSAPSVELAARPGFAQPATPPAPPIVGRKAGLARLATAADEALAGKRRIVWIAGEPGIGKTTLLDHFAGSRTDFVVARGQCVEQFGASEPYLPVLEALGSLCRADPRLAPMMRSVAPVWMLQIPWLGSAEERAVLRAELAGATQDRMLREMGELLDRYTREQPLLLVTEDLHWSDDATVRLIDHIARRRDPARLLWVGTVRLAELVSADHPLKDVRHELRVHRLCEEIALDPFSEVDLAAYIERKAPSAKVSEDFVRALYRHTDGLPLFVATVVEDMVARGGLRSDAAFDVPESLAGVIERQIARLPAETQALLGAASVAGPEFRAAIVAAALDRDAQPVAGQCDDLARQQHWISGPVIAPSADGTLDARYTFRHALYRHVFYGRAGALSRAQLHRRVAAALEAGRASVPIASSELASHYERAHDVAAALRHYAAAADEALDRRAPREAMSLTAHALKLLPRCPDGDAKVDVELALLAARAIAASQLLGAAAPEAREAFERTHQLTMAHPSAKSRALELSGLGWTLCARGDFRAAAKLGEELYAMAVARNDRVLHTASVSMIGTAELHLGEPVVARKHLEESLDVFTQCGDKLEGFRTIVDLGVLITERLAHGLSHLGFPDTARKHMEAGMRRAEKIRQPFARLVALVIAGALEVRIEDVEAARPIAQAMRDLTERNSFEQGRAMADWLGGWVLSRSGRPDDGYESIASAYRRLSELGMLWGVTGIAGHAAEAALLGGRVDDARVLLDEALALSKRTGERLYFPDLHIVGSRIAVAAGDVPQARTSLQVALVEARKQQALWLEVSALTELCALEGARPADRAALTESLARLTEGLDTALARRARALIAA